MAGKMVALVVALAVLVVAAEGTISCNQVYGALEPCLSYISSGGNVPRECCNGITSLVSAARTVTDRRTACSCLKQVATGVPGPTIAAAAAIPGKCGIPFPYKISPYTDCSKVK